MSKANFMNSMVTILMLLTFLLVMIILLHNRQGVEQFVSPLVYNTTSIPYKVGEYDGLVLKGNSKDYPMLPTSNAYTNTYQGFAAPLTNTLTTVNDDAVNAPPVDGKTGSPQDLFMFAHNQCRPECCPSAFSCSGGCVCVTDQQKQLLSYRGHNSTYCTSTFVPQTGHPVGMFGCVDDI
jgi:hypothetical protein